jgi:hypothetical protein
VNIRFLDTNLEFMAYMERLEIQFSHARTGLKIGLQALGVKPGHKILVPDFCCDVIYHPLNELEVEVVNYEVREDLSPDWDQLSSLDTDRVFGVLMVHYFGQPQDIERFRSFCQSRKIYLIEDNAHGYGGSHKGKPLGMFGDIGISSPRKILKTSLGGVLYIRERNYDYLMVRAVPRLSLLPNIINFIKFAIYRCKPIYKYLAFRKLKKYDYSDPYAFTEGAQSHTQLSYYERSFKDSAEIDKIAKHRRDLWVDWKDYLTKRGLSPVFIDLGDNTCPWAIAFYSENIDQRNSWINWGLERRLPIFCWPSLPSDQILKKGPALKKWQKMLCVALEDPPPLINKDR